MARKDHSASGSALAGAGAVTAGTGFVAGGIPGAKVDINAAVNREQHPGVKGKLKQAKATPGGILGFRHKAHAGGIYGFKQQATENAWKGPTQNAHEAFFRGRTEGKIPPEEQVLRHLKGGKKAAGAAMAGGAALTAYGLHRRKVSKADRREKSYQGALLGTGAATAGVSHGATKLLGSQEKKWSGEATRNVAEAGRLAPNMPNPKVRRGKHVTFEAIRASDVEAKKDPKAFKGVHPHVAQEAGRLRGAAIQQAHFADVYRDTGKMVGRLRAPGLVAAAAGAGGLALSRKRVKKSMTESAFGVDHGEITKFDYGNKKKPSAGRRVLASAPYTSVAHPLVAGKKGKKARAFGNQVGGSALGAGGGSVAGSLAGAALTRGRSPIASAVGGTALGTVGGIYGSQRGLARNTRKGYLKKES